MKRACLPVLLLAPLLFALSAAAAALRDAVPVPEDNPMTPAKIELGRRLFYDADPSIRPSDLAPLLAILSGLTDRRFLSNPDYALPSKACGRAL